ncbi:DUF3352 domain-containing protein [Jatrophihabitans sp. DSM 45814]
MTDSDFGPDPALPAGDGAQSTSPAFDEVDAYFSPHPSFSPQPSGGPSYLLDPNTPSLQGEFAPLHPVSRRSHRGKIIGAVLVAILVAGAGAGAYAYSVLASGGTQPEHVLPGDTVAFAKIDLDPAAGQKIAAYRLSQKFPSVSHGATNITDVRNSALTAFLGASSTLDYNTDVKPWLGDRVAVAAVPDAASSSGVDPVLAIAYTDQAKMFAAMAKLAQADSDFDYVSSSDYVLISDSQTHANALLTRIKAGALDDNAQYKADVTSLPGDQIAVGWVNLAAATAALKAGRSNVGNPNAVSAIPASTGRLVVGAHADASYLEVDAVVRGMNVKANSASRKPVDGALERLPADTTAALEFSGLGDTLSAAWNSSVDKSEKDELNKFVNAMGLVLPGDLQALFGSDTTASLRLPADAAVGSADSAPKVAVQTKTDNPQRSLAIITKLRNEFPIQLFTATTADGYVAGNDAGYNSQLSAVTATLGNDPNFGKAVPNAKGATAIGYVNVASILNGEPGIDAEDKADWQNVAAVGLSVNPTSDGGAITIRITTR